MSCSILISGSDIDYNKALCNALLKITNVYEITLSEKRFDKRSSKNYFAVIINNTENDIGEIIWKYAPQGNLHDKFPLKEKYNKFQDVRILSNKLIYRWQYDKRAYFDTASLKSNIICIFSASCGVGKTSFARALSKECSGTGESVLYINGEIIPSQNLYFSKIESNKTINRYLYHVYRSKHGRLSCKGYITKDMHDIYYFNMPDSSNELMSITDVEQFIGSVVSDSDFDKIILDIDFCGIENLVKWLKISTIKVMIEEENYTSQFKNQILMKQLNLLSGEDKNDVIKIINKCKQYSLENQNSEFVLPFEEESFRYVDGLIDINLDKNYGMGVKKFARGIKFQ